MQKRTLGLAGLVLAVSILPTSCAPGGMSADRGGVRQSADAVVACAAGPTLQGIDVSGYQGNIDWGAVATAKTFAIMKATEGTGFVDGTFASNWAGAHAAGVIRGAYHFFHPSVDPAAQANRFADVMGPLGAGDLPPMLDLEVTDGLGPGAVAAATRTFVDTLQARTGRRPLIYTGYYFWRDQVGDPAGFSDYPLVMAAYVSGCPLVPDSFGHFTMWQYSDAGSVPGIGGNVDLDVFNGDINALHALAGEATSPVDFDARFYLSMYSDLQAAFGTDLGRAADHWIQYGRGEGRMASPAFHSRYYLQRYDDLSAAFGQDYVQAIAHWESNGIGEGREGSPAYSSRFYLALYPDLQQAFGTDASRALDHWLNNGIGEGRRASPAFDPVFYVDMYPDLAQAFGTDHRAALWHWFQYGIGEGRTASFAFDPGAYLSRYADLRNAFGTDSSRALWHWLRYGIDEGRQASLVFDPTYYLALYPDLRQAFGADHRAALQHWFQYGIGEGRRGSADFDPAYYLGANPDVAMVYGAQNYAGAITHWLRYGRAEGRAGVAPVVNPQSGRLPSRWPVDRQRPPLWTLE